MVFAFVDGRLSTAVAVTIFVLLSHLIIPKIDNMSFTLPLFNPRVDRHAIHGMDNRHIENHIKLRRNGMG